MTSRAAIERDRSSRQRPDPVAAPAGQAPGPGRETPWLAEVVVDVHRPDRLRLDAGDLGKLHLGPPWGPFSEGLFSLTQLHERRRDGLVGAWRRVVENQLGEWAGPLLTLSGARPQVDLPSVVEPTDSADAALASFLAAPTTHLRAALRPLTDMVESGPSAHHLSALGSWLRGLAEGDLEIRRDFVGRFGRYLQIAILPYWEGIRAKLDADRAHRTRIMAERGIDRLLASLHPGGVTWRPPVLEVTAADRSPAQVAGEPGQMGQPAGGVGEPPRRELPMLGRRSLVLVPSVFALGGPYVLRNAADDGASLLLVYPILGDVAEARAVWRSDAPGQRRQALGALLGQTRASALAAVAHGCTTTELARRIGATSATASHHASVLREAGLISTRRRGNAVLHTITHLGRRLLEGNGSVSTGAGSHSDRAK